MDSITYQQANTSDGTYDVNLPRPYPVTVTKGDAFIGYPQAQRGSAFATPLGFVEDPDQFAIARMLNLRYMLDHDINPQQIVGTFPVYLDEEGINTDTRVITKVLAVDGVVVAEERF